MHRVEAKGAAIPAIGMGTWTLEGDHCAGMVPEALRVGYRHVDRKQDRDCVLRLY